MFGPTCTACYPTLCRACRFNPITTLYYIAPVASCFLAIPFTLLEARGATHFVKNASGLWHFLLNGTNAFALNLSVFLLLGRTSALTMNICGLMKDWFTIAGERGGGGGGMIRDWFTIAGGGWNAAGYGSVV